MLRNTVVFVSFNGGGRNTKDLNWTVVSRVSDPCRSQISVGGSYRSQKKNVTEICCSTSQESESQ